MVKTIMKDIFFLGQKSEPASREDLQVGRDLQGRHGGQYDRSQKTGDYCEYGDV